MSFQKSMDKIIQDKSDPFHLFFDVQAVHQNADNQRAPLQFNETRNTPFIMSPKQYFLSIVRFNVSTSLPVFIPKIQTGLTSPDKTIYNFYISSSAPGPVYTEKVNFEWVTQSDESAPSPNNGGIYNTQKIDNEYYYCYNYQYFISLMNKQIATSLAGQPAGISKVWFELNKSTFNLELKFLVTDITYKPKFFINEPLKNLMSLFPLKINPIPNYVSSEKTYEIMWENIDNQVLSTTIPYIVSTDSCCLQSWNPISSIVFTTTSLPVVASEISKPLIYGSNVSLKDLTSNNNTSTILTDFTVTVGPNNLYSPEISYLPTAEYRMNDMFGNAPLKNIDLQVWWKDRYNNYYPLYIPSGGRADIKILFRKKVYNTNSQNLLM